MLRCCKTEHGVTRYDGKVWPDWWGEGIKCPLANAAERLYRRGSLGASISEIVLINKTL